MRNTEVRQILTSTITPIIGKTSEIRVFLYMLVPFRETENIQEEIDGGVGMENYLCSHPSILLSKLF